MRNLLYRLWAFEREAPAFLDGFAVPFDSNQAERDLRPIKVQPKLSGTLRSEVGVDASCTLLSVLSMWHKQGRSGLAVLETAFADHSLTLKLSC